MNWLAEYDRILRAEMAQPHWSIDARKGMALARKWLQQVLVKDGTVDVAEPTVQPFWATETGLVRLDTKALDAVVLGREAVADTLSSVLKAWEEGKVRLVSIEVGDEGGRISVVFGEQP